MKRLICALLVLTTLFCSSFSPDDYKRKGTISGEVIYPGEGIPSDMVLVAQSVETQEEFRKRLVKKGAVGFVAKMPFSMKLKPGTYYLYVVSQYDPVKNVKAFYTEFNTCGMHVSCKSHKKIPVVVEPRKKVDGIILGDWYQ